MPSEHLERRSIAEQAAAWLEALDSADREQRAGFLKWLKASPLHVHELLLAARVQYALTKVDPDRQIGVEELIGQARAASNVRQLAALTEQIPKPARSLGKTPWAAGIAASLAALVLMTWWAVSHFGDETLYTTKLGEQRMVKLDDGSVVFLNTQTRIQVRYARTARDIYLHEGQALFQVHSDAVRPFRVHAASAVIQALGTQFDVRLDVGRAMVAVVEGAVRVSVSEANAPLEISGGDHAQEPSRITAGEAAIVELSGGVRRARTVDTKAVTAWRQQRLIFDNTPLTEIVSEFNRYNTSPRLRVEGAALAARRFDGSFNALRPESFLTYLSQEQGLDFERHENEVVISERVR